MTAGRRSGIVIQMLDEKMEPAVAKEILKGQTDPLNSSFHLGCVRVCAQLCAGAPPPPPVRARPRDAPSQSINQ